MDRSADIRQSGAFICKKWTLFTFAAVGIVVTIIMASMASKLLETYVDSYYPNETKEWRQTVKETAMVWVWVISGLSILFHLVGLMGSYKEHYCMTVTYAVLITLAALSSITSATKNSYYWFETVLYFIICGVTYAYAYDLRRVRIIQFSTPAMVVIGGASTPTIINMGVGQYAPGQAYVAPQYGNQYGHPSAAPTQGNWNPPTYSAHENKMDY